MFYFLIIFASFNLLNGQSLSCDDQPKDIVFILDSSGSISDQDFNHAKTAIFKAVKGLNISENQDRVALVQFATQVILKFNLDTYKTVEPMLEIIQGLKLVGEITAIGKALRLTVEEVLPKMRQGVKRFVILVTDGANNVWPQPFEYADKLKQNDVKIICFGIGSEVKKDELIKLASPNSVILISSYEMFIQELKRTLDNSCKPFDQSQNKPCIVQQQDLIFVFNSSESLTLEDFSKSKTFVETFVKNVIFKTNETRNAIIIFSNTVKHDSSLDKFTNKIDYINEIDKAKKFGIETALGKVLDEILITLWQKHRKEVPFNVVFLSNEKNNKLPNSQIPELNKKGAFVISVGIGKEITFNELIEIASNNKIITVYNYEALNSDLETVTRIVTCG